MALSVPSLEPPAHVRERLLAAARKPSTLHRVGGRRRVDRHRPARGPCPGPGRGQRAIARDLVIRAEPGAVYPSHKHHGPEECFVISGSVVIDGRVLRAGDFHHADEDSDHGEITTTEGAEVLIVGVVEDYLPSACARQSRI